MSESLQALMAIQGALTAISGGFNAFYFAGYPALHTARKVATLVLSLVNLSFLLQGLYWVLPVSSEASRVLGSGSLVIIGVVTLMSSLAMTALILRQKLGGRDRG